LGISAVFSSVISGQALLFLGQLQLRLGVYPTYSRFLMLFDDSAYRRVIRDDEKQQKCEYQYGNTP
jgi:hypothetical protein